MSRIEADFRKRCLLFGGWVLFSAILFVRPLILLFRTSVRSDDTSYAIFIPLIAGCTLFSERHRTFRIVSWGRILGGGLLLAAVCAGLAANHISGVAPHDLPLCTYIFSLVMAWVAGFSFVFGRTALKEGLFPILFAFLMVPLPQYILDHAIYSLQASSAWIAGSLFDFLDVPVIREHFVLHLTNINIEVAKECSGIRSSMVLLILALLVAHRRLRNPLSKTLFVAFGLFVMMLKNAIRIVTLALLAMYVDPGFLSGRLHREGGVVFFLLGLFLLYPILRLLELAESQVLAFRQGSCRLHHT